MNNRGKKNPGLHPPHASIAGSRGGAPVDQVGQVPPAQINLDQIRIEHAARARRDGDMVEAMCEGIFQLMAENERLRARVAELEGKK